MSFADIGKLTDKQIYDIIFRPRDDKGQVVPREGAAGMVKDVFDTAAIGDRPHTPENELTGALLMAGMVGADPNKVKAQWEAKHGRSADEALAAIAAGGTSG